MIENLEKAEQRFAKIEEALADPAIFAKQDSFTALMKERKSLLPVIEKYREYKSAVAARDGAAELRDDASAESELRELAEEEFDAESRRAPWPRMMSCSGPSDVATFTRCFCPIS